MPKGYDAKASLTVYLPVPLRKWRERHSSPGKFLVRLLEKALAQGIRELSFEEQTEMSMLYALRQDIQGLREQLKTQNRVLVQLQEQIQDITVCVPEVPESVKKDSSELEKVTGFESFSSLGWE